MMELIFLGTNAGVPTQARNVTSMVVNNNGRQWMFDCGEGTQQQILKCQAVKASKLEKIFITHLHGDHIFGLPGLLCSRSMNGCQTPLTLYGPTGLKQWITLTLELSGSWLTYPLDIVETEGGLVCDDGQLQVTALPLIHGMPCYGYRIEEHARPGVLDAQRLAKDGIPRGPWLQALKQGKTITLDDGRVISGAEYLGPSVKGKSLAIMGDTAPSENAIILAKEVDVLVHEATLEAAMEVSANERGHSTTQQAARIAQAAAVKRLVITHFSARYGMQDYPRLLAECQAIFPCTEAASDFCVIKI